MAKVHRERYKTYHGVFDEFTNVSILKLISKGHLDGLEGEISIGKEASVFSGLVKGQRVAVKVYRMSTCDFNKMYEYIRYDPRFAELEKKRRKVILAWAQREYRNLLKARQAGVNCPIPRAVYNNVLIMEFIGKQEAAPRLKDAFPKNPKVFFNAIIKNMAKLHSAGMVHTDLSHFNILNHKEKPVFIDFSQATIARNPRFQEYLDRDIRIITRFFSKYGLKVDEETVKKQIQKI